MPFLSLVKALGFRAKFFLIAALAALAVAMSVAQVVMERVAMIQATRAQTEALAGVNLAQQYLQALQAHKSLLLSAEGADASAGLPAAPERIESTHAALLSWHVAEHRGGVLEDAWRSVEEQAGAMAGALPEHFSGRKAAQALHGHGMHSDTVLAYLAAISDRYGLVPDRDIDTHHLAHIQALTDSISALRADANSLAATQLAGALEVLAGNMRDSIARFTLPAGRLAGHEEERVELF